MSKGLNFDQAYKKASEHFKEKVDKYKMINTYNRDLSKDNRYVTYLN